MPGVRVRPAKSPAIVSVGVRVDASVKALCRFVIATAAVESARCVVPPTVIAVPVSAPGLMPRSPLVVVVPALATETPRAEKFAAAPKLIVVVAALAVFGEIALEIDAKTRRLRLNAPILAYLSLKI